MLWQDDVLALRDVRLLEQVLQQLLGRKVWILASIDENTIPFRMRATAFSAGKRLYRLCR